MKLRSSIHHATSGFLMRLALVLLTFGEYWEKTVEMWSRHTRHVIYLPPTTAAHLAGTHSYDLHRRSWTRFQEGQFQQYSNHSRHLVFCDHSYNWTRFLSARWDAIDQSRPKYLCISWTSKIRLSGLQTKIVRKKTVSTELCSHPSLLFP